MTASVTIEWAVHQRRQDLEKCRKIGVDQLHDMIATLRSMTERASLYKGSRLGSGSFGTVWGIEKPGDPYAVKRVKHASTLAFMSEADIHRTLSSPPHAHIVRYRTCVPETKCIYMEWCVLGSLCDYMHRKWDTGEVPTSRTLQILVHICRGLKHMHQGGYIHCDLNPHNIMVCKDRTVKLGDFGLAVKGDRGNVNACNYTCKSPEMSADQEYTNMHDMWSLGCIAFWLFTRELPFQSPTGCDNHYKKLSDRGAFNEDILQTSHCPSSVKEVIRHLLQVQPSRRPCIETVCKILHRARCS